MKVKGSFFERKKGRKKERDRDEGKKEVFFSFLQIFPNPLILMRSRQNIALALERS